MLFEVAKGTGIVPGDFSKDGGKEPAAGDRVTMLIELKQAKETRQWLLDLRVDDLDEAERMQPAPPDLVMTFNQQTEIRFSN